MSVTVSVDDSGVKAKLALLAAREPQSSHNALEMVADEVLRLSQQQVPHDTGSLQNSGTVQPSGRDFIVGYHKVYAARLHEHPEYRFQKGRKGKYLEDPIVSNSRRLGLVFGDRIRANLLRGL